MNIYKDTHFSSEEMLYAVVPTQAYLPQGLRRSFWYSLSHSIRLYSSESVAISIAMGWFGQLSAPYWSPRGNSLVICLSSCEPPHLQLRGREGSAPMECLWMSLQEQPARGNHCCFILFTYFLLQDYYSLRTEVKIGSKSLIFSLYNGNKIWERRKIIYVKYKNKFKCHIKIVDLLIYFHIFLLKLEKHLLVF